MSETRYVKTKDAISIAYQVRGSGPVDLVWITGFTGNLEIMSEQPLVGDFFEKLGLSFRVIRHDRRATGLSDRATALGDLEVQVDDLLLLLDTVGADRAVVCGSGWGAAPAAFFGATYPARTRALVLHAPHVRVAWAPDYRWGITREAFEQEQLRIEEAWGTVAFAAEFLAVDDPSISHDPALIEWYAKVQRHWVTPSTAAVLNKMAYETDVRHVLSSIQSPTLVTSPGRYLEVAEYVTSLIPGATVVRLANPDFMPWAGDTHPLLRAIEEFVGVERPPPEIDRVLATVLFTDIVDSTRKASEVGDHQWKQLLSSHHDRVRAQIQRFLGREIGTTGDGFLVTFEGPARAIRCAQAIVTTVRPLGIEIRAGLHTGELELSGATVQGIAVHIGARVAALAGPGEILVSSTVKDLVAGSGIEFKEWGTQVLKGVPGTWRIYAVASAT